MIALVLVSHSVRLAEGLVELAAQMAPDVPLLVGAGTSDGGLDDVEQGLAQADGVAILADLGSAVLTTESAIDLEDEWSGRVLLAQAPFVEGAVVAAVAAQQGGSLDDVVKAAVSAAQDLCCQGSGVSAPAPGATGEPRVPLPVVDGVSAVVTLRNPLGLHARPAAQVARAVAELGVPVTIGGVDGASVLQLLALGATGGQELTVAATGDGARDAVAAVVALIETGFGEV